MRRALGLGILGLCHALAASAATLVDLDRMPERALALVDERLALMPEVAAAKARLHLPVADPARETVVIEAAGERAQRMGLDRESVVHLFEVQIRRARETQQALTEQWRGQGVPADIPVRALATELRPRIDALTTSLLQTLYLAAPILAEPASADRLTGAASQALPSTRWNAMQRAELVEALLAVRERTPRSPERAAGSGVLRIGTPADYAPFSLAVGDHLDGVDILLGERLAQGLGLEAVYVRTTWRGLLADLAADRFDIALGGISVTSEREAAATFSVAIARSGKTALGRCSDRSRFTDLSRIDRPDVNVIENPGGTNEAFARKRLRAARLRIHPDNVTIFDELRAGRADVMFTDEIEVRRVARSFPELCRLLTDSYDASDKAILLPREPAWRSRVDAVLGPIVASGEPARWLDAALDR